MTGTVLRLAEIAPRPTWAEKHVEFMVEASKQVLSHLDTLSDRQFDVEYAEMQRVLAARDVAVQSNFGDDFIRQLYDHEAEVRGNGREVAADNDTEPAR